MSLNSKELYAFKDFRLDVGERLLLRNGQRIQLPEKAFETLCVLVRQNGHLVTKDELFRDVWPDTIVEGNNLDKNISLLRNALGDVKGKQKFIETVRGRGYRFVEEVRKLPDDDAGPDLFGHPAISPAHQKSRRLSSVRQRTGNLAAVVSLSDWRHEPETVDEAASVPPPASPQTSFTSGRYWLVVLAIVVCAGLGFLGFYSWSRGKANTPINSVAVLPFVNVGGDAELEYLSDGLAETLIDRLSELPQLKVIVRSSSFKYRDENLDLQDVARKLGVQAIVTGRVARRGDDLTIRVELIDARDNKQLWGEQFNRKAADVLAIQSEIALTVSGKLRLKLSGAQEEQLANRGTDNPQAYELLLKGDYLYRTGQAEKVTKAIEYYQQAIALDPNYALAYARIARSYVLFANNSILDPKDVVPKAKTAAQKAVELDENLADAHLQLAMLLADEWDWTTAERGYVRALELNPNHQEAHNRYSGFLSNMGRHEQAIAEAKRAKELDPERLNAAMPFLKALLLARRFDETIAESKKILEIEPKHRGAIGYIGAAYSHKGMHAEAVKYLESIRSDDTSLLSNQIYLGAVYARAGETAKARAILRRLETTKEYVSPGELSILYATLGEREKAFASLEKAYAAHDLQLKYLNADPSFDPMHDDPRFQDLLRQIGLPQ